MANSWGRQISMHPRSVNNLAIQFVGIDVSELIDSWVT